MTFLLYTYLSNIFAHSVSSLLTLINLFSLQCRNFKILGNSAFQFLLSFLEIGILFNKSLAMSIAWCISLCFLLAVSNFMIFLLWGVLKVAPLSHMWISSFSGRSNAETAFSPTYGFGSFAVLHFWFFYSAQSVYSSMLFFLLWLYDIIWW